MECPWEHRTGEVLCLSRLTVWVGVESWALSSGSDTAAGHHASPRRSSRRPGIARARVMFDRCSTLGFPGRSPSTGVDNKASVITLNGHVNGGGTSRRTQAVDIFALGCIFHHCIVPGSHPFGQWYEREANIMQDKAT